MTDLFHFTHISNLSGIVAEGGLHCDSARVRLDLRTTNIAYTTLKQRRARTTVPCSAGGTLSDYVPFYFAPRSPMLYAIRGGQVQDYQGGQQEVVYLRSSVEQIVDAGLQVAFTDGHPVEAVTDFYDDPDNLNEVDWPLMGATYWNNTMDDPDRRRRRQAEFLVHEFVPLSLIEEIGALQQTALDQAATCIVGQQVTCAVELRPEWYFR